jgi:hypothetical protein
MIYKSLAALSCGLLVMACGSGAGVRQSIAGQLTYVEQTMTLNAGGVHTHRVGKRWVKPAERGEWSEGDWSEVQVMQIDCRDNDVLLVWGETTVRFPAVWPAAGPLVVHGTFDKPPLRIEFPEPIAQQDGREEEPTVEEVLWYSDRLDVDGVMNKLLPGGHYVFTGAGLQESPAQSP